VPLFAEYALRAYKYANALTPAAIPAMGAQTETCSRSAGFATQNNCIGVGCTPFTTMGPCARARCLRRLHLQRHCGRCRPVPVPAMEPKRSAVWMLDAVPVPRWGTQSSVRRAACTVAATAANCGGCQQRCELTLLARGAGASCTSTSRARASSSLPQTLRSFLSPASPSSRRRPTCFSTPSRTTKTWGLHVPVQVRARHGQRRAV
jgi:hypothetical protein